MQLIIKSEDEAWELLRKATQGDEIPDDVELSFLGWPSLQYDFKGRDWNSTVPTRVMTPLLEVQKDVNRAYARAKYGEANLRRLKEDERDDLEIVVKVEEGSSLFSAELWKQINQIAKSITANMTGKEKVILVLGIALAIASPIMWKEWLSTRLAERQQELHIQLSEQETKRLQIFAEAIAQSPAIQSVNDDARATQNRLLKTVKPDDKIEVGGTTLSGGEAAIVVQPDEDSAQDVHLQGDFRILANHTDKSAGFRIKVERITDHETLTADVPLQLPADQKELIEKAEWAKGIVHLHITASLLRGSYSSAIVSSAEAPKRGQPD